MGVLSDGALTNQSWDTFEAVLWPKILGAWHLHRATAGRDLDLFVLFSSITAILGNSGQGNHGAANAFLDQLAAHRRALGLAGQSVAWGAWSGLGEAEEQRERIAAQLEAVGTGWITPQQGLGALDLLLRQDAPATLVAAVDWPTVAAGHGEVPPFLEEVVPRAASAADDAPEAFDDLLTRLRGRQAADAETLLVSFVQTELQAVMRLPAPPAPAVGFFELGMDSLMAVELRNRLNRAFAGDYTVSNTAVFDYPDITALARHLAAELAEPGAGRRASRNAGRRRRRTAPGGGPRSGRRRHCGHGLPFPRRPGPRRLLAPARVGDRRDIRRPPGRRGLTAPARRLRRRHRRRSTRASSASRPSRRA